MSRPDDYSPDYWAGYERALKLARDAVAAVPHGISVGTGATRGETLDLVARVIAWCNGEPVERIAEHAHTDRYLVAATICADALDVFGDRS